VKLTLCLEEGCLMRKGKLRETNVRVNFFVVYYAMGMFVTC